MVKKDEKILLGSTEYKAVRMNRETTNLLISNTFNILSATNKG